MTTSFDLLFKDFFLKMKILDHKMNSGSLTKEYKKIKQHMKIIIPIFNRLLTDPSLTEESSFENLYENTYPRNTHDVPKEEIIKQEPKVEEVHLDETVSELNANSLKLLSEYRKLNWLHIES